MTDKKYKTEHLSHTEQKVFSYIANHGPNVDVPINDIYYGLYGLLETADQSRTKQQVVGAFISRINRKLHGAEIKPGRVKQTYRLVAGKTDHTKRD